MSEVWETRFGFEYGAATVERVLSDSVKGWVLLRIRTPKHPKGIQVYVTKTGEVCVYASGEKWQPPPDDSKPTGVSPIIVTAPKKPPEGELTLSGFPMVGYRNART